MENIFKQDFMLGRKRNRSGKKDGLGRQNRHRRGLHCQEGTLSSGLINEKYIIKAINTNNEEMKDFLFTLGCYEGESITIISILSDQYVVVVKDARYSIDCNLASCIII